MNTDVVLTRIAAKQHGLVTTAQARRAGIDGASMERRCRVGLLTRVHHGVYRSGAVESPHWREMAAVLAFGGAVGRRGGILRRPPAEAGGTATGNDADGHAAVAISHHCAALLLGSVHAARRQE
jgi:hypothetical protein